MTKRFQLLVDDETLEKLAELDLTLNAAAREKAGNLNKFFAVWRYMDMAAPFRTGIILPAPFRRESRALGIRSATARGTSRNASAPPARAAMPRRRCAWRTTSRA